MKQRQSFGRIFLSISLLTAFAAFAYGGGSKTAAGAHETEQAAGQTTGQTMTAGAAAVQTAEQTVAADVAPVQRAEQGIAAGVEAGQSAAAGVTEETKKADARQGDEMTCAGIDGIRSCVDCMRGYYTAEQAKVFSSASDEILAGTRAVNRSAVNRSAFFREISRAGELGYVSLQAIAENQMSYNDYYTLLQIVEAEATGGDVQSKLLIANVVLNRVEDPRFPDNIYQVVWQRTNGSAQFSPTADGRIHSCTITGSTIEAVERALSGEDNSQGALFFFARNHSASSSIDWFDDNLVKLFEYGGHEFFTFKEV